MVAEMSRKRGVGEQESKACFAGEESKACFAGEESKACFAEVLHFVWGSTTSKLCCFRKYFMLITTSR
jgi:hypothetical protein